MILCENFIPVPNHLIYLFQTTCGRMLASYARGCRFDLQVKYIQNGTSCSLLSEHYRSKGHHCLAWFQYGWHYYVKVMVTVTINRSIFKDLVFCSSSFFFTSFLMWSSSLIWCIHIFRCHHPYNCTATSCTSQVVGAYVLLTLLTSTPVDLVMRAHSAYAVQGQLDQLRPKMTLR